MFSQEIYNMVIDEGKEYINTEIYGQFIQKMIESELSKVSNKVGIKITDFNSYDKSDGCYLYLGNKEDEFLIKSVTNSMAITKKINEEEYKNILCYSYLVRIISFLPESDFNAIKHYTLKINNILKRYEC